MKPRKPFLLRIDPVLHEALEEWARQDMRSLNGQIEFLLREAVVQRRKSLRTKIGGTSDGRSSRK